MYVHVKSFQMKLSLFSRQTGNNRYCHFPLLKEAKISGELAAKYKVQLDTLAVEFDRRLQDFKNLEPQFNIQSSPFTAEVDSAPQNLQPDFYKSLSDDLFPNSKNFAAEFLTLFGSTYICKQAFSSLKINKLKNRYLLTDINLHDVMRISASKLAPNFKKIVKTVNSCTSLNNF